MTRKPDIPGSSRSDDGDLLVLQRTLCARSEDGGCAVEDGGYALVELFVRF
jgi:hypothetical protein